MTGQSVSLQGRDFRFRPDTGEFEAIEGSTQYGRNRDDWGNWFGNANYTWLWHYPLPARYVARNPHLAVRDNRSLLAQYEDGGRVFPASRPLPRPNVVGAENRVTSACSAMPYRDDLFGPDFATSVFISEPSENLIHREVLEVYGGTFQSHRAAGEHTSEFLASTDNWFRPTQLKTGPDGALYVADMYRQTIEHPEWIPKDTQARIDVRAGQDRGRIYRVVPDGVTLRPVPRLAGLDAPGLLAALDSSNGWQRDTAMRLLQERSDRIVQPLLEKMAATAGNPKVRLQALATLTMLGGLNEGAVITALRDPHPAVRVQALQVSEPFLRQAEIKSVLAATVLAMTQDADPRVRHQLALSLGEFRDPRTGAALMTLAFAQATDPLLLDAVFSSAAQQLRPMIQSLGTQKTPPPPILERLVQLAAAQGDDSALTRVVATTMMAHVPQGAITRFNALGTLLDALDRRATGTPNQIDWSTFAPVFAHAEAVVFDANAEEPLRLAALRVIGRSPGASPIASRRLTALLAPQNSMRWQQAILNALQRRQDPEVVDGLVAAWPQLSPPLRTAALDVILAHRHWIDRLLGAIEGGQFPVDDIGVTTRQKLREFADPEVRERAQRLFGTVKSNRQSVVDVYASVRTRVGDAERGRALFIGQCTPCHRLQGEGHEVGPDLGAMAEKSADALLVAILDPNRAIEERYLAYTATVRGGREISGIVMTENSNSLTLRSPNGGEEVLLRSELTSLQSTHRSLMPEGFESALEPAAMADLFAYLMANGPRPKEFSGNRPRAGSPEADGSMRLPASTAEIYGDSLVFESAHRNLGFWQSSNDRAIWSVEIPRAGEFEIWLDWASPDTAQPNRLQLEIAGTRSESIIASTGSWDTYQQARIGRVSLPAGRHRLMVRGVPPLTGAILDLREIRLIPAGQAAPTGFPQ